MRKDEEVKELFSMNLEELRRRYRQAAVVTCKGVWVTIEFGLMARVTGRGYLNALRLLGKELELFTE